MKKEKLKEKRKTRLCLLNNFVMFVIFFFFTSENVDPSDELKIVIRDALTIGQGHFFGEISIPIQSLTKNAEIEQWYTILPSKSTTHKVFKILNNYCNMIIFFFFQKQTGEWKVIVEISLFGKCNRFERRSTSNCI